MGDNELNTTRKESHTKTLNTRENDFGLLWSYNNKSLALVLIHWKILNFVHRKEIKPGDSMSVLFLGQLVAKSIKHFQKGKQAIFLYSKETG